MWFRNLQIYRLHPDWTPTAAELEAQLARHVFHGCQASDAEARGWVPPRGNPDELVVSSGDALLICLGVEQKLLPASVIRQYADERLQELEEQQGYKPGRKQAQDVREAVTAELLPKAFVRRRITYAWFDRQHHWCAIDAGSTAKAEEVIEQLKLSLGDMPLLPCRTQLSPTSAMTGWLAAGDAPADFTIDRDCELRAVDEEKATVRYSRHNLDADEVRAHIEAGKTATRLALTWQERISFVLTEDMQVKRLAFLDILKEEAEREASGNDELFEADLAIMSGELVRFLPHLMLALGGEGE